MYADRYHSTASRPAGAGASLLICGAIMTGLIYPGPKITPGSIPRIFEGTMIELPKPKPEPKPEPRTEPRKTIATTPRPHIPDRVVDLPTDGGIIAGTNRIEPVTPRPPGPVGPVGGITVDPPRTPVLVGATIDSRYAEAFQPPYPPAELRAQTEGAVTARVLVGVDGRVKAIEILASPSEGLASATRRQALARWRFKPATRDGIPVEGWKAMTVRFRIVE